MKNCRTGEQWYKRGFLFNSGETMRGQREGVSRPDGAIRRARTTDTGEAMIGEKLQCRAMRGKKQPGGKGGGKESR